MIPNDYDLWLEREARKNKLEGIKQIVTNGRIDEIEHFVVEFIEEYTKDVDIREVIQLMRERLNNNA